MADQMVASVHSLCIDCLAVLDLLERLVRAPDVQSRVEACAGCRRTNSVTYRFRIDRHSLGDERRSAVFP
jgi:hypothetical protein